MSLFVRNSSRFLLQNTQKRKTHASSCGDTFRPLKASCTSKTEYKASSASKSSWLETFYVERPYLSAGARSSHLPATSIHHRKETQIGKKNSHLRNPLAPTPLELVLRLKQGTLPIWSAQPLLGSPQQLPPARHPTSTDKDVHNTATWSSYPTSCDIDNSTPCSTSNFCDTNVSSSNINLTQSKSNVSAGNSIGSDTHIVQCSKLEINNTVLCRGNEGGKDDGSSPQSHLPTLQQLKDVELHIQEKIPLFFRETHQYNIYVVDIEFHNNIAQKPYKTKGLLPYVWALTKLRMFAHVNYVRVEMRVLKTTVDEDLGIVQVRWQVIGMPQSMAIKVWKLLKDKNELVIDGFSTLSVNKDGKIYKHVADNVMPDQERKRRQMSFVQRLRERWRLRPDAGLSATAKK